MCVCISMHRNSYEFLCSSCNSGHNLQEKVKWILFYFLKKKKKNLKRMKVVCVCEFEEGKGKDVMI